MKLYHLFLLMLVMVVCHGKPHVRGGRNRGRGNQSNGGEGTNNEDGSSSSEDSSSSSSEDGSSSSSSEDGSSSSSSEDGSSSSSSEEGGIVPEPMDVFEANRKSLQAHKDDPELEDEELPDGIVMMDGDILISQEERAKLIQALVDELKNSTLGGEMGGKKKRESSRDKRGATFNAGSGEWLKSPDGLVYIQYDYSGFTAAEQAIVDSAIQQYDDYTCIRFRPRFNFDHYIRFIKGTGCRSYLGKISATSGFQDLSLEVGATYTCMTVGTVLHELAHALGHYHEHNRPNRDQFINVLLQPGDPFADQFDILAASEVETHDTSYDFRSILHYSGVGSRFNMLQQTDLESIVGRTDVLSFYDIKAINSRYECSDGCAPLSCPTDSFQAADCNCYCFSGDTFDPIDSTCGEALPCALGENCFCDTRTDSPCSSISNSACDTTTGACECDSGYIQLDGETTCTDLSTLSCTLGENCFCDIRTDTPCSSISNSACDIDTGACECNTGYIQLDGETTCTDLSSFTCTLGENCFCEIRTDTPCSSISNSACDTATGACECSSGYVQLSGETTCTDLNTLSCDVVEEDCACEMIGSVACAGLSNSECDVDSGACVCSEGYFKDGGMQCAPLPDCMVVNEACNCVTSDDCSMLSNADCNAVTGTCECAVDTYEYEGDCVAPEDVPCDSLHTYCFCSLKDSSTCSLGVPDSVCDDVTDECICSGQFLELTIGSCTDANTLPCTLGVNCHCNIQTDSPCSLISNSACDTATGACECDSGFVQLDGETTCTDLSTLSCTLGENCFCEIRTDTPCSSISNSACDTDTGACECDTGYIQLDGETTCTDLSSFTCTLGGNCFCEIRTDTPCSSIFNSACDTVTGACECDTGYTQLDGETTCTDVNTLDCDTLEEDCACGAIGSGACDGLPNSECDTNSGACVCSNGYIKDGVECTLAPGCVTLDTHCFCSTQDSACSSIPNSVCDNDSDQCVCPPNHLAVSSTECEPIADPTILSGTTVYPFINIGSNDWVPASAGGGNGLPDLTPEGDSQYLWATGLDQSDTTSTFTLVSPELQGQWCLDLTTRHSHAELTVSVSLSTGESFTFFTLRSSRGRRRGWGRGRGRGRRGGRRWMSYRAPITVNSATFQFRIEARRFNCGNFWAVLDRVVLSTC